MRIGILTGEFDKISQDENLVIWREIERRGHKPVVINYGPLGGGYINVEEDALYVHEVGVGDVIDLTLERAKKAQADIVIPRYNEAGAEDVNITIDILRILLDQGILSTTSPEVFEIAKNKLRTRREFRKHGIPFPRTIAPTSTQIENPSELLTLIEEDHAGRWIVKPVYGTLGEGVAEIDGRNSGNSLLPILARELGHLLLEERIATPGDPEAHEDKRFVVSDHQYVTGYKRWRRLIDPNPLATTKPVTNVYEGGSQRPYQATKKEREATLAVAEACAPDGSPIGVDAYDAIDYKGTDKELLFGEVNASLGLGSIEFPEIRQTIARTLVIRAENVAKLS
jgi:glutathione synthase/RimK-type ligase-like ATP-grasp enzyme